MWNYKMRKNVEEDTNFHAGGNIKNRANSYAPSSSLQRECDYRELISSSLTLTAALSNIKDEKLWDEWELDR